MTYIIIGLMIFVMMLIVSNHPEKKRRTLIARVSDGRIFIPSYPDAYSPADAWVDLLDGTRTYYFRELDDKLKTTGNVWTPSSHKEFIVLRPGGENEIRW